MSEIIFKETNGAMAPVTSLIYYRNPLTAIVVDSTSIQFGPTDPLEGTELVETALNDA